MHTHFFFSSKQTRVLVTHGVQFLPKVDRIVVIAQGEISETGSYDELLSHDGPFAQFLKTYLTTDISDSESEDEEGKSFQNQNLGYPDLV